MKHFAIAALASACAFAQQFEVSYDAELSAEVPLAERFEAFIKKFGRDYTKGSAEYEKRFGIFEQNCQLIDSSNQQKLSYTLAVNEFADMEHQEFASTRFGIKAPPAGTLRTGNYHGKHVYSGETLPQSIDWVAKGGVSAVKNQGQCGSCWSFSTTGALEGAWFAATGKKSVISEQQFIDCDPTDHGCNGGLMDFAFDFAETHQMCSEKSYPYEAAQSPEGCRIDTCGETVIPQGGVTGYQDVDHDEEALMSAVVKQPVSVAIEANLPAFQFYQGGVLKGDCGHELDHGVLLVGYGVDEDGSKYWKIKNSWGPQWGENGYVRVERGIEVDADNQGKCGVLKQPSFPVVSAAHAKKVSASPSGMSDEEKQAFIGNVMNVFASDASAAKPLQMDADCERDVERLFADIFTAIADMQTGGPDALKQGLELIAQAILSVPQVEKECSGDNSPQSTQTRENLFSAIVRAKSLARDVSSDTELPEEIKEMLKKIVEDYKNQDWKQMSEDIGELLRKIFGKKNSMSLQGGSDPYSAPPCVANTMHARLLKPDGNGMELCAPKCGQGMTCTPAGKAVAGKPRCALQDQSGGHYCALMCRADSDCEQNEKCQNLGVAKICGVDMHSAGSLPTSPLPTLEVVKQKAESAVEIFM